jgi:hypothetical protein
MFVGRVCLKESKAARAGTSTGQWLRRGGLEGGWRLLCKKPSRVVSVERVPRKCEVVTGQRMEASCESAKARTRKSAEQLARSKARDHSRRATEQDVRGGMEGSRGRERCDIGRLVLLVRKGHSKAAAMHSVTGRRTISLSSFGDGKGSWNPSLFQPIAGGALVPIAASSSAVFILI